MRRRAIPNGVWKAKIANYYNLNTFCLDWIQFTGKYQMPVLQPAAVVPDNLFPFDERNKYKAGDGAIHFYCEDCEFENVWLRANRFPHVPAVVSKAGVALTPDFSLFTDFPVATQIWNVYRARLLGALWQSQSITVIPSVSWGLPESFEFCFDGLPIGGTFAVATTYVKTTEEQGYFLQGFKELIDRCQPETVLVYGRGLKGRLEDLANVRRYDSRLTQIRKQREAEARRAA